MGASKASFISDNGTSCSVESKLIFTNLKSNTNKLFDQKGVSSSDSQHFKCSIKAADLRLYSIYFGISIYRYGFDLR